MASRLTMVNYKQADVPIFELVQNIIGANLLTKFHDERTINTASRVLTRKNATPPWRPYIIGTNHLTKFHDDRTINRTQEKNAPPPGGHVFSATETIFKLIQDIIRTNLLTKFHEDRKINVASRVLTRKNAPPPGGHFHEDRTINVDSRVKNAPPLGSHVFQANVTIFKLIQDIIETNLLNKFHEDWTINVASRVFTSHIRKNAPALGSHVFQANVTIFEVIQDIIKTNLLTKFHEDWTINVAFRVLTRKTALLPGGHVFSSIWTIFELAKIVTSRVFTRNTALPPGGHVFQRTGTIFELNKHII
ncbi:hypothetical protein DPMN_052068 [Dreissena polymorpha]|uniref:Uncharacterized protein n=1 Tax=Dreissena polymorpha TaxID=45954 RepID=A0A9D4CK70_DREPO|nr:hypothetical protein DPMN_052068 [Dreissena polymorpha]